MTSATDTALAERVAERGREIVVQRLRAAFARQAAAHMETVELDPAAVEQMVSEAATRAGEALWRRSLAQAVVEELDIELADALAHPALVQAYALVEEAPAPRRTPAHRDVRAPVQRDGMQRDGVQRDGVQRDGPGSGEPLHLEAVHIGGIEALRRDDRDIELRLSEAGLDVLKRSSRVAIGRLEWSEIEDVELPRGRRGRRGRPRSRELHVTTGRGQARFELPDLSDEEIQTHLAPTLARLGPAPAPLN